MVELKSTPDGNLSEVPEVSLANAEFLATALELEIADYLEALSKTSAHSGSNFNQGVVRGLEVASAQFRYGHARKDCPMFATLSRASGEDQSHAD
jgi:hypothetical protein